MLTFRDTGKIFELEGDLLKMITNKNYNVDLASLADKKLMYDFAKKMNFDVRAQGNKSTRERTLIKLLKSPAIMASGISTKFLSSDPDDPIVLFSNYKLTSCYGKILEELSHAHIVSLSYILMTSSRGSDDLSMGLDRDRNRRQRELTNKKNIKGKYHVTLTFKDIFGVAEQQEKGTYGLDYRLILTKKRIPLF